MPQANNCSNADASVHHARRIKLIPSTPNPLSLFSSNLVYRNWLSVFFCFHSYLCVLYPFYYALIWFLINGHFNLVVNGVLVYSQEVFIRRLEFKVMIYLLFKMISIKNVKQPVYLINVNITFYFFFAEFSFWRVCV